MKRLKYELEDLARNLVWWTDYIFFRLTTPTLKPIPKINSILIIDLKFIGDLVIDTPMIRALKESYPNSKISFLLPPEMKDVLKNNPNIDHIYTSKLQIKGFFDLGILLYPGDIKTSQFLKSKANYRVGIRKSGLTEPKGFFLHRKTIPNFKIKHKIDDNLDVLKTLNIEAINKSLEIYSILKPKYKNYIVIAPVSNTHPSWPDGNFAELADKLHEKYDKRIIFPGSKKDRERIGRIQSLMKNPSTSLAGKTSIQEYFSLIKHAFFVACIDTSAQHIAAAFKVPVVTIFSAGDKRIWSPYSNNSVSLQAKNVCTSCMKSYCSLKGARYLECAQSITVDKVVKEISYILPP
jgi:heptosyltransferase II